MGDGLRLAILDDLPAYTRGLLSALQQAGLNGEEPSDLLTWIRGLPPDPVPLEMEGEEAAAAALIKLPSPNLIQQLHAERPGLIIVAMLSEPTLQAYRLALNAGADAAVSYDSAVENIVAVLLAALHGECLLPIAVVRGLTAEEGAHNTDKDPCIDPAEVELLRALAQGEHVSALAKRSNYSQRTMYRRLDGVFAHLGVNNRHEAIVQAERLGLL